MLGFVRVAAVSPEVRLGNIEANARLIESIFKEKSADNVGVVLFPELSLSGYSCGDMFLQTDLLQQCELGIEALVKASESSRSVLLVGAPLRWQGRLFNSAVVIQKGQILGVVPKASLPNHKEFYERRWFCSGAEVIGQTIRIGELHAPFGCDLLFSFGKDVVLGVEICEDSWTPIPPSSKQAIAGANILVNLSASNAVIGKAEYRQDLVRSQSERCLAAYVYASAGCSESSSDLIYSGHLMISENGRMLAENQELDPNTRSIDADIDCQKLSGLRLKESTFKDMTTDLFRNIVGQQLPDVVNLRRVFDPHPFCPSVVSERDARCSEIFGLQVAGLRRRVDHVGSKEMVIGLSGGLDSTLAFLVCHKTAQLTKAKSQIRAVTMPGFGTSERTLNNAKKLAAACDVDLMIHDISSACDMHLKALDITEAEHSVAFENVQARERTQVLMDLANRNHGLVIGTGDLSEMALGWCTFNGDHMSMYAVNCGVPKTLVQHLVGWYAEQVGGELGSVLKDILSTPISPELLSIEEGGEVGQKTEDIIGPYELHDFFLFHRLRYGSSQQKIQFIAERAFGGKYDGPTITKWLEVFLTRFKRNQFKRNAVPDGPKVGTIALSPRGDWRMPSDMD